MPARLAAVGPSLVDLNLVISDTRFDAVCRAWDIAPGGWREIATAGELAALLSDLGAPDVDQAFADGAALGVKVAGSTTLAMLAVSMPRARRNYSYVSTLGVDNGRLTFLSAFYHRAVRHLGIAHRYGVAEGETSVGLVVAGQTRKDKLLFFSPGVSRSALAPSAIPPCDLLIVDAYELRVGDLAACLDQIILSGEFRIGLSLGNAAILHGDLLSRLLHYLRSGKIFALVGNEVEYRALLSAADDDTVDPADVDDLVRFALMTRGPAGMVAAWDGQSVSVPAELVDPARIVSTSGAGDAAAGVFFAGIAEGADPTATLARAARSAAGVLQLQTSLIAGQA